MNNIPQASRPYTTRAQRVLALAEGAAAALNHEYIGAEHILLGLLEEKTGIAAQILAERGLTSEHVREELRRAQG
jgi:ATP-dependent Clp protease ATP-binding subunit ClpC